MLNIKISQTELDKIYGTRKKGRRRYLEERSLSKTKQSKRYDRFRYHSIENIKDKGSTLKSQSSDSIRIHKLKKQVQSYYTSSKQTIHKQSPPKKQNTLNTQNFMKCFLELKKQVQMIHGQEIRSEKSRQIQFQKSHINMRKNLILINHQDKSEQYRKRMRESGVRVIFNFLRRSRKRQKGMVFYLIKVF